MQVIPSNTIGPKAYNNLCFKSKINRTTVTKSADIITNEAKEIFSKTTNNLSPSDEKFIKKFNDILNKTNLK